MGISPWQLAVVVILIVLLFGGKKLPELARALGKAKGEFKKGTEEGERLLEGDDAPKAKAAAKLEDDRAKADPVA